MLLLHVKGLCISAWPPHSGTPLAAACCLQTGLWVCSWAAVGPGWKRPSGAQEVRVLHVLPAVDWGAAAPSHLLCDPFDHIS